MSNEDRISGVPLIDTSHALTEDELQELKKLAAYSKAARWLVAGILAASGALGIDRILSWLKH